MLIQIHIPDISYCVSVMKTDYISASLVELEEVQRCYILTQGSPWTTQSAHEDTSLSPGQAVVGTPLVLPADHPCCRSWPPQWVV